MLGDEKVAPLAKDGVAFLGDIGFENFAFVVDSGAEKYRTGTTWKDYRRLLGFEDEPLNAIKSFDRADLMLEAAIGGLGVALGRSLLIEDDVRRGLLIPLGKGVRVPASYWLVTKPELAASKGMQLLRDWLKEQIRLTPMRRRKA